MTTQQQQQQPPQATLISAASPTNIEAERLNFYNRCTADELNGFIKARMQGEGLPDELKDASPKQQLLQLDRQATFPLMDMPKDIRLMVYEELLTHDSKKHSQILATGKIVQDEAQGFLDKTVNRGSTYLMRIHSNQLEQGFNRYCGKSDCPCRTTRQDVTVRHGLGAATTLGPVQIITKELAAFPAIPPNATTMILDIVIGFQCTTKIEGPWNPNELINR